MKKKRGDLKTYVVVREEYNGPYGGAALSLNLHKAATLDALVLFLEKKYFRFIDTKPPKPSKWLRAVNGDGTHYYIIKELLPSGKLGKTLIG